MANMLDVATTRGHDAADKAQKQIFGRHLARLRVEAGLTQGTLARKLGLAGQQAVSAWESGERMPDISMWPKIAHQLGVSPHHLASVLWGEWDRGDTRPPTIEEYALRIAEMAKTERDSVRRRDGDQ